MTARHFALFITVGFCYSILMRMGKGPGKEFTIIWSIESFSKFKAVESPWASCQITQVCQSETGPGILPFK